MERDALLAALPEMGGNEAKLLLHQLLSQGGKKTNDELMRETGISNRRTFFRAKAFLVERGWLHPCHQTGYTHDTSDTHVTTQQVTPMSPGYTDVTPTGYTHDTGYTGDTPTGTEIQPPESDNWRARLAEADRMPGSTATDKAHDPAFRARRETQVKLLQSTWKALLGQDLTIQAAKGLLQLADDWSEDILDKIEEVQARGNIQSPLTYIRRIFEKERAEKRTQPPVLRSSSPVSESGENGAERDDYYLSKPSPRTAMVLARLKAAGKLVPDEDDDDE